MSAKVLFLDHAGEMGGAELSLLDLARPDLVPPLHSGCAVMLFSDGPFRAALERAGVPVSLAGAGAAVLAVRRGSGFSAGLRVMPALLGLARHVARKAGDFDVLYANSQKALVIGALAARMAGRPLIWHLRDMLTEAHFGPAARTVAVLAANFGAARIIANSKATADAFVAAGGRRSKTDIVYNGIDPAPFDRARQTGSTLRDEIGSGTAPVIGVFGRLAPWKGQHIVLDALRLVPEAHLVVVGGALFGNEAYEATLRETARNFRLQDRVHFFGFRQDIPALMQAVDIIVHSSVAPEPFGRVIVEGMMARKPVIATSAGGAVEIVADGVDGLLVAAGDVQAMARALDRLIKNPAEAATLALNGSRTAHDRFAVAACRAGVKKIIDHVCGKRRRRLFKSRIPE